MNPPYNGKLANILRYHIVRGKYKAVELKDEAFSPDKEHETYLLPTLSGQPLRIQYKTGGFKIDSADIIHKDIKTVNGWIQVINKVLMPPEK